MSRSRPGEVASSAAARETCDDVNVESAELLRDLNDLACRYALEIHLRNRQLQGLLASDPALQALRIELESVSPRHRPDLWDL